MHGHFHITFNIFKEINHGAAMLEKLRCAWSLLELGSP